MRFLCLAAACGLMACGSSELTHDSSMVFGDVALGESRSVALQLTNSHSASVTVSIASDSPEFTVDGETRTLRAGETTTLLVRFTPADVGIRTGTLKIGSSSVALSGRGTGPRLSVASSVTLPTFLLVRGRAPEPVTTTIVLRNTGTAGSLLGFDLPQVDGSELCVGTFEGSRCVAWQPGAPLDTESLLEVPLSLRPTTEGLKHWTVTFFSNDRVQPEVTVDVRALVEMVEPCVFSAPFQVELVDAPLVAPIALKHTGPGTCVVQELSLSSSPTDVLRLVDAPSLPLRLSSGESFTVSVGVNPGAPTDIAGSLSVRSAGNFVQSVLLKRESQTVTRCLTVSPSTLDFGTVAQTCNSATRNFQLYNSCSFPITIDSVSIAAGEGEFLLVSSFPPGTTLPSGVQPLTFAAKYAPSDSGSDTGAISVKLRRGGEFIVALQGRGDVRPDQVDTFRQETPVRIDMLVMVDSSPSFVPNRPEVRANLTQFLNRLQHPCLDTRWAIAAADGDPNAGVTLLANDAGSTWTSSREPDFVNRALSAFDALPVGSEIEACVGPAAAVIADAGVRANANFSALCITDALEQSMNPMGALQQLQSRGLRSWNAVTGLAGACSVEAEDNGLHSMLVNATSGGIHADICSADWGGQVLPLGFACFGYRVSFFLTSRPVGPLEVAIDGRSVDPQWWWYDATNNTVTFLVGHEPQPGQTLEVRYTRACYP